MKDQVRKRLENFFDVTISQQEQNITVLLTQKNYLRLADLKIQFLYQDGTKAERAGCSAKLKAQQTNWHRAKPTRDVNFYEYEPSEKPGLYTGDILSGTDTHLLDTRTPLVLEIACKTKTLSFQTGRNRSGKCRASSASGRSGKTTFICSVPGDVYKDGEVKIIKGPKPA